MVNNQSSISKIETRPIRIKEIELDTPIEGYPLLRVSNLMINKKFKKEETENE